MADINSDVKIDDLGHLGHFLGHLPLAPDLGPLTWGFWPASAARPQPGVGHEPSQVPPGVRPAPPLPGASATGTSAADVSLSDFS